MIFSKLLAAFAGTLLLKPLSQVHGATYDIIINDDDNLQIGFDSLLVSDTTSDITQFICKNGSSDEHYVGTTNSRKQTLNVLIRNDKIVVGSIVDEEDGNVYHLSADESGDLQTVVTHTSDFPEELDPIEDDDSIPSRHLRKKYSSDFEERVLQNNCPNHVIDVLCPWTKEAECKHSNLESDCVPNAATTQKIKDLIQLAIDETNTAYKESGVRVNGQIAKLNLAMSYLEPSIKETSFGDMLGKTRDSPQILAQREKYGADVVATITSLKNFCGMAYLGPAYANMFSVTTISCATGYYSFGHEIGHNMGANHDRGTSSACASTKYSYGYREPSGDFRSILAYSCTTGQCDQNRGNGCTRVQRFSNKEFKYSGKVIGDARNDNARQHSDEFATVSAYRQCKTTTPTSAPTTRNTCVDDDEFAKRRGGRIRTCKYIGDGRVWRMKKWCNKKKQGIIIKNICCKTCEDF